MSIHMEQAADAIIQAANEIASMSGLDDRDAEQDTSSSLSEIDYKDSHQDEGDVSEDPSNGSEEENDSEAETERLEVTPNKIRTHKDVVLSSHNNNQIYERSPSKLHNQINPSNQHGEEEDELSDDDLSINDSPKSSNHDEADPEVSTAPTSLEDSADTDKRTLSIIDADTRKRKRSIMAGSGLDEEEPLRKRTGSVINTGDDFVIDDEEQEEADASNPISGTISGDEGGEEQQDGVVEEAEEPAVAEEEPPEQVDVPVSPKKRGRKKKKTATAENGVSSHEDDPELLPDADTTIVVQDDSVTRQEETAEVEGDDEAEAAARNEEELERKRIAAEQLSALEKQFTIFRDRLYNERLEALNREEAMLREDKPTHPEYLAMMQAIDARRDERLRISEKLREYEIGTLKTFAVARRSQILVQFQQDVRDIRERKLEQLGKQWYEIQHDRRSYAGNIPDYTLKFPTQRSQQVMNQIAYSNEVSILSGVAKYVGFPAAPAMSMATDAELADDFAKMGRSRLLQPVHQHAAGSALHELAALRNASSMSRFKPAEEQFIEQTPWANPRHIAHGQTRRQSHQHSSAGPISGTFSNPSVMQQQSNGISVSGGRVSPHNPFSATVAHQHTIVPVPSPLGSRQPSLSPRHNRHSELPVQQQSHQSGPIDAPKNNGIQHSPHVANSGLPDVRDLPPHRRGMMIGQL